MLQLIANITRYFRRAKYVARRRKKIKEELDKCPDQESRERRMVEIREELLDEMVRAEEKERQIELAINRYNQMAAAILDLKWAIVVFCQYPNEKILREDFESSPEVFRLAKNRLILYARWIVEVDPVFPDNEFIKMIGPINIDSYKNLEEWDQFFQEVGILCETHLGV